MYSIFYLCKIFQTMLDPLPNSLGNSNSYNLVAGIPLSIPHAAAVTVNSCDEPHGSWSALTVIEMNPVNLASFCHWLHGHSTVQQSLVKVESLLLYLVWSGSILPDTQTVKYVCASTISWSVLKWPQLKKNIFKPRKMCMPACIIY